MDSKLHVFILSLFSRHSVIAFMISYSTKRSAIISFFHEIWGGGVMYLVYCSSSSSYMDCMVFFGDEC